MSNITISVEHSENPKVCIFLGKVLDAMAHYDHYDSDHLPKIITDRVVNLYISGPIKGDLYLSEMLSKINPRKNTNIFVFLDGLSKIQPLLNWRWEIVGTGTQIIVGDDIHFCGSSSINC